MTLGQSVGKQSRQWQVEATSLTEREKAIFKEKRLFTPYHHIFNEKIVVKKPASGAAHRSEDTPKKCSASARIPSPTKNGLSGSGSSGTQGAKVFKSGSIIGLESNGGLHSKEK